MDANIKMGWDAVLAGRKTGVYYLHDQEPLALKLTRVLGMVAAEKGGELAEAKQDPELEGYVKLDDPMIIGQILALFMRTHEATRGPGITIRRLTKTENDQIRAHCKKERLKAPGGDWYDKIDEDDYSLRRCAAAIVEPAIPATGDPNVPGDDLRAKAEWLRNTLSQLQIQEIHEACRDLDGFNLQRIEELVKN